MTTRAKPAAPGSGSATPTEEAPPTQAAPAEVKAEEVPVPETPSTAPGRKERNNERRRQRKELERVEERSEPRVPEPAAPPRRAKEELKYKKKEPATGSARDTRRLPEPAASRTKQPPSRAASDPGGTKSAPSSSSWNVLDGSAGQSMGSGGKGSFSDPTVLKGWWWTDGYNWYQTGEGLPTSVPASIPSEPPPAAPKRSRKEKPEKGLDRPKSKPRETAQAAPGRGGRDEPPRRPPKEPKRGEDRRDERREDKPPSKKRRESAGGGGGGEEPPDWGGDDDGDDRKDSEYTYTSEYEYDEESESEEAPPTREGSVKADSEATLERPKTKRKAKAGAKSPKRPAASEGSTAPTEELQEMMRRKINAGGDRSKPSLNQVKLETFTGIRSAYKDWKRVLHAQRSLYALQDKELSMIVYLSCKGEARDILNQLTMDEMSEEGGLQRMLNLLEETYGSRSDERFETARTAFEQYRRSPGQPVSQYIAQMKRLRIEYLAEDDQSVISDKAFAQRLLSRAALSKKERMDVFFNAGGRYEANRIEKVLRFRCSHIHEEEHKHRAPSRATSSDHRPRRYYGRGSRPKHRTYVAEDEPEEDWDQDADDEDLEEEARAGQRQEYWDDRASYDGNSQADYAWYGQEDWWSRDEGYWQDWEEENQYSQDEEPVGTMAAADLSEAYAAGWRAKAQSAGYRQARGYRNPGKGGGSKGKKGPRVRPTDRRNTDDRKRASKCSSCGNIGHWRGDPECPKVIRGEDPVHERHQQAAPAVSEANVAFRTPSSPTSTTPVSPKSRSPPGDAGTRVTRVNFTMLASHVDEHEVLMVYDDDGEPWDRIKAYESDSSPSSKSERSMSGFPFSAAAPRQAEQEPPKRPSKDEFKLALKTVMRTLGYDDDEIEKQEKKRSGRALKVKPTELLQAIPHMDRKEKKLLYQALKAEEEAIALEAFGRRPSPEPDKMQRAHKRSGGYRATRPTEEAAATSSSSAAAPPAKKREVPEPVRKKQLETFRRTLYENALTKKGYLKPSTASEFPNGEQERCKHEYEDLKWGANAHAHWAHCRRCKLKRVLYYHDDHGALGAEDVTAHQTFSMGPALAPGEVIVDTGCRTAVAGCDWHHTHQGRLTELGLGYYGIDQHETFRFGAGPPIVSLKAFLYPCFTHGRPTWLRISLVDGPAASCPGLV